MNDEPEIIKILRREEMLSKNSKKPQELDINNNSLIDESTNKPEVFSDSIFFPRTGSVLIKDKDQDFKTRDFFDEPSLEKNVGLVENLKTNTIQAGFKLDTNVEQVSDVNPEKNLINIENNKKSTLEKKQTKKTKKMHWLNALSISHIQTSNQKKSKEAPVDEKKQKKPNLPKDTDVNIDNEKENPIIKKESVELKGFGWKNLGKKQIVFDEKIKDYVYKVIEPQINEEEIAIKNKLIHLFNIQTNINVSGMDVKEKNKYLEEILNEIIIKNNISLENEVKNRIFYYIFQEFIGYGKIDILMHDDRIEDISCDGFGIPIFIHHRDYDSIKTDVIFEDEEVDSFVIKLAQICNKQISIYEPIVDGKLPDGSRLQATLAKTVTKSSTFTIRRFRENPLTPIDLINNNTISAEMAAYFWMINEYGVSILFCGGTASGKTTMLNALSLFIPSAFKIVSVEDTREINLPHENWIAGTTRTGFLSSEDNKSEKDIDMFDLIKASLRQRPRVIIVGEIRGKEAYSLFQAMATGHLSYSTIHASNLETLIQRLESPPISLPRALLTSLDVLLFIKASTMADGKVARRLTKVVEIIKIDPESKRLISVTPFSWISALDDRFQYNGGSSIIEKIKNEKGWNNEQLIKELTNRKNILEWMQKNNMRSYLEVGKIVADYKTDPNAVLKRIKEEGA